MDIEEDEPQVSKGFDRDIDYESIKEKLITAFNDYQKQVYELDEETKNYIAKRRILMHKLIYITIACIQLINGSRILEAVKAFRLFIKTREFSKRVTIKLAKSETTKYKKGKKYVTKARFREMKFPQKWITLEYPKDMKFYTKSIENPKMKKRVLDYLLKYQDCNTHSLRYAFINYMLYVKKWEMGLIGKFIGHSNLNQLIRYTQTKNSNKIFDLDI